MENLLLAWQIVPYSIIKPEQVAVEFGMMGVVIIVMSTTITLLPMAGLQVMAIIPTVQLLTTSLFQVMRIMAV